MRASSPADLEALSPQEVHLPSGVALHWVREGQGTPLVMVHGAMGDWRSWTAQWPALVPHYDCISYSRRYSHPNRNTMPSPHHSALDEAEDLSALLQALGLSRAIVVGSSYGGFTALALALRHPEQVMAVVAVEPPMMKYAEQSEAGRAVVQAFRQNTIEPANALFRAGRDEEASRIMTGGINGGAGQTRHSDEAMRRRLQNMRAMKALALSSDEFPWLPPEQLAALPMPTLLLSGADTAPVHRAIFDQVVQAMPQAEHHRVQGSCHGVSREQPEVFNRLVLEFLQRRLPQA